VRLEAAPGEREEILARELRMGVVFGGLAPPDAHALAAAARAQSILAVVRGGEALLLGPALLLREAARDVAPALGHALAAAVERAEPTPHRAPVLRHARGALDLARPAVMGILNVTPDSFSDGGLAFEPAAAIARGERLADEGAAIVDVGGESTRPGARPVPEEEEARRVIPVVAQLARTLAVPISVDTRKAAIARRALDAGAAIVNDVSALADPAMAPLLAERGAGAVLVHMRGAPETMQEDPRYEDVLCEVASFLARAAARAEAAGVAPEAIALDPGLGFGKTAAHNLEILARLDEIASLGHAVVIGISRKRTLGEITGRPPGERLAAGLAAAALAVSRGARVVRAHDVKETRDALAVAHAIGRGAFDNDPGGS
jgi:dihydropteroate synthase